MPVAILDAILNISNSPTMPAEHHPDSNSMHLPLPKSAKTCLGVFLQASPQNQGSVVGLYMAQ